MIVLHNVSLTVLQKMPSHEDRILLQRKRKAASVSGSDFSEDCELVKDSLRARNDKFNSDTESCYQEENNHNTPSTPHSLKDWPSLVKSLSCPFPDCTKKFNRQAKLRDHLHYHTGHRPFKCHYNDCTRDFPRKTHLDRHIKSAHTDVRDYKCTFNGCDKGFSTGTRLRRHEKSHENRQQFTCSVCSKSFRKHTTLQKHISTDHQGRKAYVCTEFIGHSRCSAEFDRASGLSSHKARVHSIKNYFCTLCFASCANSLNMLKPQCVDFSTYSELIEHNRVTHPPTCQHCQRSFETTRQLARHLELDHGIPKQVGNGKDNKGSYVCKETGCGKSFTKNGNLQIHIRSVHLQMRPYSCGTTQISSLNNVFGWSGKGACGQVFKAKSHLEEHIRTVHLGMEHRHKQRRIQAKQVRKESISSSVATSLRDRVTGKATRINGVDDPQDATCCPITGCRHTLKSEHDLSLHLYSDHGFQDYNDEITKFSAPLSPLLPADQFTIRSQEKLILNTWQHDMTCFNNTKYDLADCKPSPEFASNNGPVFWFGDEYDESRKDQSREECLWEFEKTEMQELIGDGNGWETDILVDPTLRDL